MSERMQIELASCQPHLRRVNQGSFSGYYSSVRRLYDHYFLYVHKGTGFVTLEDQTYQATSGDLFFSRPGRENSFLADENDPFFIHGIRFDFVQDYRNDQMLYPIHSWAYMEDKMTKPVYFSDFQGFPPKMNLAGHPQVKQIIIELYQLFSKRQLFWQLRANGLFLYLIALLARYVQEGTVTDGYKQKYHEIIEYINEHYMEPLNHNKLSKRFRYHPDHLNKIVTQYTSMTLRQYIIDLRLRSAIELLQLGQLNISQIASTVGYPDLQSFSRMFKLKMGVSPTLYRDQYIT